MALVCPDCDAPVPAESISMELGIAECPSCGTMFETKNAAAVDTGLTVDPPASGTRGTSDPAPIAPAGVELARAGDALVLTYTWSRTKGIFLALFALFWCGVVGLFVSVVLASGQPSALLFLSLHILAGVGVAYTAVAHLYNTTVVQVHRGRLEVEIGPIPWPGRHSITAAELDQLYVQEVRRRTKNGTNITYDVRASAQGRDFKLVNGFSSADPARFIERVIENHLGIADRAMPNEH